MLVLCLLLRLLLLLLLPVHVACSSSSSSNSAFSTPKKPRKKNKHRLHQKNAERGGFVYVIEFPFDAVYSRDGQQQLAIAKVGISGTKVIAPPHPGSSRWRSLRRRFSSIRKHTKDIFHVDWPLPTTGYKSKNYKKKRDAPITLNEITDDSKLVALVYIDEKGMQQNVEDTERFIRALLGLPFDSRHFYNLAQQLNTIKPAGRINGATEYVITDPHRLGAIRSIWEYVVATNENGEAFLTVAQIENAIRENVAWRYAVRTRASLTLQLGGTEYVTFATYNYPILDDSVDPNAKGGAPRKRKRSKKKREYSSVKKLPFTV